MNTWKSKNPNPPIDGYYPQHNWAIDQQFNIDGQLCDICKCGVYHPNHKWIMEHPDIRLYFASSHPCCGCCLKNENDIPS